MKIYVFRHGITEMNKLGVPNGQTDEPLAPEGFEQARKAALLVPDSVKRIYASSLLRTRQTAEIVNSKRGLPVSFHDELMEVSMGSLEGKDWDSFENGKGLRERHRALEFDYREFGGEHNQDFKKRVLRILKMIKAKHKSGEVLLIGHGGIVRLLTMMESGQKLMETENLSLYTFDLEKVLSRKSDSVKK